MSLLFETTKAKTSILFALSLLLTACGGGGSDSSAGATSSAGNGGTTTTQPTISIASTNCDNCKILKEVEIMKITSDTAISAIDATYQSGIAKINGNEVNNTGETSFDASKELIVTFVTSMSGDYTFTLNKVKVGDTWFEQSKTVNITMLQPVANVAVDFQSFECGEGNCTGTVYSDIAFDGIGFTLDDQVSVKVETSDGTYELENNLVSFPNTTQADLIFSIDKSFSVQKAAHLTTNIVDFITISGTQQEVKETLKLSFDRLTNVGVELFIPTIFGGGYVTTNLEHEEKAIKEIVQFGPGIETKLPRVYLENLTYSFEKWDMTNEEFVVINSGTISNAKNISVLDSQRLAFYADTTPWVYRVSVSSSVNGDTLSDSAVFVKREEQERVYLDLFPEDVTPQRVTQLHEQYDAFEEGEEFSSTLASLYPREYKDENGNISPVTCLYSWELIGMFPNVNTVGNIAVKKYCNQDTRFNNANIQTDSSMMLNVSSPQHDDLIEQDFSMPLSAISVDYLARKGSNVLEWKFYSFANPGKVEVLYSFESNSGSANALIEFDVANAN